MVYYLFMRRERSSDEVVRDFMQSDMMKSMLAPHIREARRAELKITMLKILAVVGLVAFIAYNIWFAIQPIDYQLEMRCRQGDSIACVALKGK